MRPAAMHARAWRRRSVQDGSLGRRRAARSRARMPSRSIDPGPFVLCFSIASCASLVATHSRSFSTVSRSTCSMSWFCGFVIRRPGKTRSLPNRIAHTRADSARVQIADTDGTHDAKPTLIFRSKSCLPMAPGLRIGGAETSVRRRFLRSASDKSVLGRIYLRGASDLKHNRGREINAQQLLAVRMRARDTQ